MPKTSPYGDTGLDGTYQGDIVRHRSISLRVMQEWSATTPPLHNREEKELWTTFSCFSEQRETLPIISLPQILWRFIFAYTKFEMAQRTW